VAEFQIYWADSILWMKSSVCSIYNVGHTMRNSTPERKSWGAADFIGYLFFCESDNRKSDLIGAAVLLVLGLAVLLGLFWQGWMPGSPARGIVAWLSIVLFFSKPINLVDCGGPIPAAIVGVVTVIILEKFIF